ncbi:MAG: type IV pilus secretin PilQ [Gammaproteobacteria bacterium]|nr:MAG: type IV pilus secretin PilQ [Gammaproteobacteria bacterium]
MLKAVLLGLVFIAPTMAASTLQDLQFAALPGDQVEITLLFDSPPPIPVGYSIEKPARIALDLVGAKSALKSKYHTLDVGNTHSITVVEASDRARLIISLDHLVAYTTRVEGNALFITVGQEAGKSLARKISQAKPLAIDSGKADSAGEPVSAVESIDFIRGEQGEGQVLITLSRSDFELDLREESGRIVVEVIGEHLPERLRRRLDVTDFATPVKRIDAIQEDGNSKFIISAEGDYEYLTYQADRVITVSVKPVSLKELEKKRKETFLYTGEKLSLNFQDIEVRSVLQLIADFTSLNLVASDTVDGSITLRLQNVPWDQALELILKTKGLDKRRVGNVMLVAPADEIAAREKLELEANRQVAELAPLRSEFVQVNYAKAIVLQGLLAGESGLLSTRGTMLVDERTNTILIQDTASKIEEIRDVITVLDVPVKQVLIEARIVVANSDFTNELGVAWGGVDGGLTQSGVRRNIIGGSSETIIQRAAGETVTNPQDLVVDFGVVSQAASSIAFGILAGDAGFLELELSALEAEGKGEIISTPKVLTADQQPARISSGTEIPYEQVSSSGATNVVFKEAVLSLEVTPQITPDSRIIMQIKVNNDSVGELFGSQQIPAIDTNEIETTVLVDNGETVVLGGIFSVQSFDTVVKTPFFGDLPIIGRLFRQTVKTEEKQELLVFITPKVIHGALTN